MFSCKVCKEKDARLADLKAQVEMLYKLVSPPSSPSHVPVLHVEHDAILSGRDEPIHLTKDQQAELAKIESEADRIFAANY